jgi:exodeoxyribonuclease VII small subunit
MQVKTFENSLENSKKILNQLMNPSITLEESLKLYENGIKEIKFAQKMIEEAKVKITTIEANNSSQ